MPPLNGFSVGRDISLTITTSGGQQRFGLLTSFKSKQDRTEQKIKGLDGKTRHVRFPDGWSGSFMYDRRNGNLENYIAQQESNYYAGVNEDGATITATIQEPNGSVSQFKYVGVLLSLDDAGEWKGDSTIKQSLSFVASERKKTA